MYPHREATIKLTDFWDKTPYSLAASYRRFVLTCCLNFQVGLSYPDHFINVSEERIASTFRMDSCTPEDGGSGLLDVYRRFEIAYYLY